MKIILFLLSISLGSFANAATGYYNENPCDIESYKDFIDRQGIYQCDLRGADLKEQDLSGANLIGADLREADLSNVDLSNADLRGAIFFKIHRSDVVTAVLYKIGITTLDHIDFQETIFKNTNLSGAKVTEEQAGYLEHIGLSGFVIVE